VPISFDLNEVNKSDVEELGWAVVECLSEAFDIDEATKLILTLFQSYRGAKEELDAGLVPNPYFVSMGIEGPRSKVTRNYLTHRTGKKVFAALWKWGGSAASGVTFVDVGTSSLGAQSLALTGAHAAKLVQLKRKYTNAEFKGYIDLCLQAKVVKATSRAAETALAVIPGVCIAAQIGVMAANAILKLALKLTLHKAIDKMAQLVHMHANLEQADRGDKPATELMKEIFKRRGVMFLCQYDVPALIREPSGWMALSDKLKLI